MQAASFNLQLSNPDNLPQNTAIATKTGCGLNLENLGAAIRLRRKPHPDLMTDMHRGAQWINS
jgi:hypothetical protein